MRHKDYKATIAYDDKDEILVGKVMGVSEAGSFHGHDLKELKAAFIETVDHYLQVCEVRGDKPKKPYSGKFNLRIDPALHANLAQAAKARGVSLNGYIEQKLAEDL